MVAFCFLSNGLIKYERSVLVGLIKIKSLLWYLQVEKKTTVAGTTTNNGESSMWDYFYLLKFLILFTFPMRNSISRMLYFSDFPSIHDIQGLWRPSGHERSTWWEAHSHQKVKWTVVKGLWCVLPTCQPPHPHFTPLSPLAEELQSLPQGHKLLTHQETVPRTKVLLKLLHPSLTNKKSSPTSKGIWKYY